MFQPRISSREIGIKLWHLPPFVDFGIPVTIFDDDQNILKAEALLNINRIIMRDVGDKLGKSMVTFKNVGFKVRPLGELELDRWEDQGRREKIRASYKERSTRWWQSRRYVTDFSYLRRQSSARLGDLSQKLETMPLFLLPRALISLTRSITATSSATQYQLMTRLGNPFFQSDEDIYLLSLQSRRAQASQFRLHKLAPRKTGAEDEA